MKGEYTPTYSYGDYTWKDRVIKEMKDEIYELKEKVAEYEELLRKNNLLADGTDSTDGERIEDSEQAPEQEQ